MQKNSILLVILVAQNAQFYQERLWQNLAKLSFVRLSTLVVHPTKQTWNLKMDPWKRRFLLETIISRFHVNFGGCTSNCFCSVPVFPGTNLIPTHLLPSRSGIYSHSHGFPDAQQKNGPRAHVSLLYLLNIT